MSMTREEAAHILEYSRIVSENFTQEAVTATYVMAIAALRGPTREQVEKVWRGGWIWDTSGLYPKPVCSKCGEEPYRRSNHTSDLPNYCPKCGAPMTDEAVDMVMERMEGLE
mgnify:FL=1